MVKIYVQNTQAKAYTDAPITSGSIGLVAQFQFSEEWDELTKKAIFETDNYKEPVDVPESGEVVVPDSVLVYPCTQLRVGVRGESEDGDVVIPTVYADCGTIKLGANTTPVGTPPTPSQAEQLQQQIEELRESGVDGAPGKSAYEYAVEGGFVGTEEEFAELLAGNSVKTFGAVGDGVTDDTAAFQAALAAERVVRVYGGTYVLSGKLLIRENCCLNLSQDTVLRWADEYTSDNCIEMQRSANLRGNHATIFVPYTFGAHVIHASTDVEDGNANDVPPWTAWNPQWKMSRYVTDINICKPNSWGGRCNSLEGDVYGTAVDIYCERNTAADYGTGLEQSFMWGVSMSGVRIAGGFEYGIRIHNDGTAWNHDMRIEAVIESCETGVSIENCHMVHLAAAIQPSVAQKPVGDAVVETKYAKYGIKLVDSHNADLSQSFVWDWQNASTDSEEYTHIAMYGNCYGVVLNEPRYHESGVDVRGSIYTDTPSNLEKMTILQEPITRWFKPKENEPYFFDGNGEKRLVLKEEFDEIVQAERIAGFTNALSTSIDTGGNIYNGVGYKAGTIVGSSGTEGADPYYWSTGYIACKAGDTLRAQGLFLKNAFAANDGVAKIVYFDEEFNRIWSATAQVLNLSNTTNHSPYYQLATLQDDGFEIWMKSTLSERGTVAYARLTLRIDDVGSKPVISVNDEITYTQVGLLADGVKVKGNNVILYSPGGKAYGIAVDDNGNVAANEIV